MTLLLTFAVTMIVATLLSAYMERSVLSMAVLFAAAGFVFGPGLLGEVAAPSDQLTSQITRLALFAVLFTEGMARTFPARSARCCCRPARCSSGCR